MGNIMGRRESLVLYPELADQLKKFLDGLILAIPGSPDVFMINYDIAPLAKMIQLPGTSIAVQHVATEIAINHLPYVIDPWVPFRTDRPMSSDYAEVLRQLFNTFAGTAYEVFARPAELETRYVAPGMGGRRQYAGHHESLSPLRIIQEFRQTMPGFGKTPISALRQNPLTYFLDASRWAGYADGATERFVYHNGQRFKQLDEFESMTAPEVVAWLTGIVTDRYNLRIGGLKHQANNALTVFNGYEVSGGTSPNIEKAINRCFESFPLEIKVLLTNVCRR